MLSLFNGMHRADIMSEIVSGRKPCLSAPFIPLLEMKWQMDNCPQPLLLSSAALPQVEMLSFFAGENIWDATLCLREGLALQTWPVWRNSCSEFCCQGLTVISFHLGILQIFSGQVR